MFQSWKPVNGQQLRMPDKNLSDEMKAAQMLDNKRRKLVAHAREKEQLALSKKALK